MSEDRSPNQVLTIPALNAGVAFIEWVESHRLWLEYHYRWVESHRRGKEHPAVQNKPAGLITASVVMLARRKALRTFAGMVDDTTHLPDLIDLCWEVVESKRVSKSLKRRLLNQLLEYEPIVDDDLEEIT